MRNRLWVLRRDFGCLGVACRLRLRHLRLRAQLAGVSLSSRTSRLSLRRVERTEQRLDRVRGRIHQLEECLAGFGPSIFAAAIGRHMKLRTQWEQMEELLDQARLTPRILGETWRRLREEYERSNPGAAVEDTPVLCAVKGRIHWEQAAPLVSASTLTPKPASTAQWRLLLVPAWFHQALLRYTVSYAVTAKDDAVAMRFSARTTVTPAYPAPDEDTLEIVAALWDGQEGEELFDIAAAVEAACALA